MLVTGARQCAAVAAFATASSTSQARRRRCEPPEPSSRGIPRESAAVADVSVDHPEQGDDRGLIGGDAILVAH
jgi:hypothetical protein